MKIAVDAFGGDNAPDEVIKGAVEAVEMYGVNIILTGDENTIHERFKALGLSEKGIEVVPVLLHVGLGTFRPVKEEDVSNHHMHSEYYEVTPEQAERINAARARGGRIVCVGTTSVRTLETVATEDGIVHPGSGFTQIFITPGVKIKAVDTLITNFHLPQSTLLMLISALMGRENALAAYEVAVKERYRFFSFGDAMMITD